MNAIKMTLILTLGFLAQNVLATIVQVENNVVEASLQSQGSSYYLDGYVKLDKDDRTISLVLQPVMPPCTIDRTCTEAMPAPVEYFLEQATVTVDECDAVIYRAEQTREHLIEVTVIDNAQYNDERCPTFLPVPETAVQIKQTFQTPTSTERKEDILEGAGLSAILY